MIKNPVNNSKTTQTHNFFDTIKTHHVHQHYNLTSITHSSNKLNTNTNTHHRKHHSIQRKKPLNISSHSFIVNQCQTKWTQQEQEAQTTMPTSINNTLALKQEEQCGLTRKHEQKEDTCRQLLIKMETSGRDRKEESGYYLQQQQSILNHLNAIWKNIQNIKEKTYLQHEINQLQDIMKNIIIKMATSKYKACLTSSPIHHTSQHPPSHLQHVETNTETYKNIAKKMLYKNGVQSKSQCDIKHTCSQSVGLELKKIMYILQQQSKKGRQQKTAFRRQVRESKNIKVEQQQIQTTLSALHDRNKKENLLLQDISNTLHSNHNHHQSPSYFNSSRQTSLYTLYEFQKTNQSNHHSDRIFLKNIVKKIVKTPVEHFKRTDATSYKQHAHKENQHEQSFQYSSIDNEVPKVSSSQQDHFDSMKSYSSLSEDSKSKNQQKRQAISQQLLTKAQSNQQNSQSKRAVLNQIIYMLNNKYHKNIQLEPKKSPP